MPLAPEHLRDLERGRRVRAGVAYENAVLDVRGLDALRDRRRPFALAQSARLASRFGTTRLLVDPSAPWVGRTGLLRGPTITGWTLLELLDHGEGLVVVLGRSRTPRRRVRPSAPPVTAVDLVLDRPTIADDDRRIVRVRVSAGGATAIIARRVNTFAPRDAIRSAVATIIDEVNPGTVAVRAIGGLRDDLLTKSDRRCRLVSLAASIEILKRWTWTLQRDWLVGARG